MTTTLSEQTILWVIGGLIGLLLTIIGWIIKYVLKRQEQTRTEILREQGLIRERIEEITSESSEIKYNYLNRFEEMNKNVTDTKEVLLKSFYDLRLLIEQNKH